MKPETKSFTTEIRENARLLGISKIGFAKVEALKTEGDYLKEWLGRGYHGTMEWMRKNRDSRLDPREILQEAKSVICVAMNYFNYDIPDYKNNILRISRYAWGQDYHAIVKSKLQSLLHFIKLKYPQVKGKIFIDAGPVMEKAWAVRSGIGWQGKHSVTITKEYGSWVCLGEIICDLEFEYDSPVEDLCGECRLCIEACPTKAITEPYIVNASRCISYQTIEHDEEIDANVATKIGRWIYGCDICQEVCPWNQTSQQVTTVEEFAPIKDIRIPNLNIMREMDETEFNERFQNNSIKRITLQKLIRNIHTVLRKYDTVHEE